MGIKGMQNKSDADENYAVSCPVYIGTREKGWIDLMTENIADNNKVVIVGKVNESHEI